MNVVLAPSLAPLAARVRQRQLMEGARHGLLVGLALAALFTVGGRLIGFLDWPLAALSAGFLALIGALLLALVRRPTEWQIALAADRLGLAERVSSALYAGRSGDPAAALLLADAAKALAGLSPDRYPVFPDFRRWRSVLLAGLLLATALLTPLPSFDLVGRRSADTEAVAATRQSVEAMRAHLTVAPTPEPLAQASDAELRALDAELARARTAAEAARAIEKTQTNLAELAAPEDYAQRRAAESLAAIWQGQPELSAIARFLAAGDASATREATQDLAARAASLDPEQRQPLQVALQQGANAARDVPDLSAALRQAASEVSRGGDGSDQGRGALNALANPLAESAAHASGVQTVQNAIAGLGQARAGLAANPGAAGVLANGRSAGRASHAAGGTSSGAAGLPGAGSGDASNGESGADSGRDGGDTLGGGQGGSGSREANGSGSGAGSGNGAGPGSGGGTGAGAGVGGGPAEGKPGSSSTGSTLGGGNQAPGEVGATNYDPVYAPSRLGGDGGPSVSMPGNATGASGETIDLPNAPLTTGAVRPYDQVYGQYAAEARQSLSRQPLPSGLQNLVQRYFSAIEPGAKGER